MDLSENPFADLQSSKGEFHAPHTSPGRAPPRPVLDAAAAFATDGWGDSVLEAPKTEQGPPGSPKAEKPARRKPRGRRTEMNGAENGAASSFKDAVSGQDDAASGQNDTVPDPFGSQSIFGESAFTDPAKLVFGDGAPSGFGGAPSGFEGAHGEPQSPFGRFGAGGPSQSVFGGADDPSQSVFGGADPSQSVFGAADPSQSIFGADDPSQSVFGTGHASQFGAGFGTDDPFRTKPDPMSVLLGSTGTSQIPFENATPFDLEAEPPTPRKALKGGALSSLLGLTSIDDAAAEAPLVVSTADLRLDDPHTDTAGDAWTDPAQLADPIADQRNLDNVDAEAPPSADTSAVAAPQDETYATAALSDTAAPPSAETYDPYASLNDAASSPPPIVTVSDPRRVGTALKGDQHTVYTVRSMQSDGTRAAAVLRRYTHFIWLYEALVANNPGVIVPAMPEKSAIGNMDALFIEQRRVALELALEAIVQHPLLRFDPFVDMFLTSEHFDAEMKDRKFDNSYVFTIANNLAMASLSEKRPLAVSTGSAWSSIFSSAPVFTEFEPAFEKHVANIDILDQQLSRVHLAIDNAHKRRSATLQSIQALSLSISALAESRLVAASTSPAKPLLSALAVLYNKTATLGFHRATSDSLESIAIVLQMWLRYVRAMRVALATRIKAHVDLTSAATSLAKASAQHVQAAHAPTYVASLSKSNLDHLAKRDADARSHFDAVSRLLDSELAALHRLRVNSLLAALDEYLTGAHQRQVAVVALWREFLALVKETNTHANEGVSL